MDIHDLFSSSETIHSHPHYSSLHELWAQPPVIPFTKLMYVLHAFSFVVAFFWGELTDV